tara:strand:+ start:406 stop:558 length:153 start_codon:yes stop_codon:yes gene_type:complete
MQERDYDYMPEICMDEYYQAWDDKDNVWVIVTHEQYLAYQGKKRFVPANR